MELDFSLVANFSLWAYVIVFAGGIVTSIGPCNIAMIPLVIAYVSGQRTTTRRYGLVLSTAFASGLAITLAGLGVFASLVGGLVGASSRVWYYLMATVCIVMGSHWLGVINLPLPSFGEQQREKIKLRGTLGALLFGLASGLVSSACATPALAAILTLVMSQGAVAYGASLLLAYGLGRGVPIVAFGTFAGLVKVIPWMTRWTAKLERFSGAVMIIIGLYFIWIA